MVDNQNFDQAIFEFLKYNLSIEAEYYENTSKGVRVILSLKNPATGKYEIITQN